MGIDPSDPGPGFVPTCCVFEDPPDYNTGDAFRFVSLKSLHELRGFEESRFRPFSVRFCRDHPKIDLLDHSDRASTRIAVSQHCFYWVAAAVGGFCLDVVHCYHDWPVFAAVGEDEISPKEVSG